MLNIFSIYIYICVCAVYTGHFTIELISSPDSGRGHCGGGLCRRPERLEEDHAEATCPG